jgi:hypothetical protein
MLFASGTQEYVCVYILGRVPCDLGMFAFTHSVDPILLYKQT